MASSTTPGSTTSVGFVKADSSNLPQMDNFTILEYMAKSNTHNIAEIRGAKALMSSRDSYLDTAVGYVELKRSLNECTVRCKVTPEHRISNKNYSVTVILDERDNEIKDVLCEGCAAAAGGCKHTLVFLFWLSKRSEEPSSTSVQCYWKKPYLGSVRTMPLESEEVFKNVKKIKLMPKEPNIMQKFIEESKKRNVKDSLISCFTSEPMATYNLFDMSLKYVETVQNFDFEKYKSDLDTEITPEVIKYVNEATKQQALSKMWHSVRQGRLTGSKIYEASQCATDGALVQHILGGYKVPETVAMKRGQKLEHQVIRRVEEILKKNIDKSGFLLVDSIFGASPDGVGDNFIVEVKCPMNKKNMTRYVDNGLIKNKFTAQMQLQMLSANKKRGLFCVADPSFETSKEVHLYWIQYDAVYTKNLMERATSFWKKYIYEKIIKSVRM